MQLKPSQELIHNSGGPSRDPNLYDFTTWPEYQFVNDPASGGSEMLDPSSLVEWSAMEEEGLKAFYLVLASTRPADIQPFAMMHKLGGAGFTIARTHPQHKHKHTSTACTFKSKPTKHERTLAPPAQALASFSSSRHVVVVCVVGTVVGRGGGGSEMMSQLNPRAESIPAPPLPLTQLKHKTLNQLYHHGSYQTNGTQIHRGQGPAQAARDQGRAQVRPGHR